MERFGLHGFVLRLCSLRADASSQAFREQGLNDMGKSGQANTTIVRFTQLSIVSVQMANKRLLDQFYC